VARDPASSVFEDLFERAPVGLAEVDSRTGRFLHVNACLRRVLGYSADELIGREWQSITHPGDLEEDLSWQRRLLDSGQPFTLRKRYLHRNGSTIWIALSVTPLWRSGEVAGTHLAVIEDVSAQVAAERNLAERDADRRAVERAQALHNRIREAILVADDEPGLLGEVCRAFVEVGGFVMAWVGLAQHDERRTVLPVAHAGREDGYLSTVDVVWSDTERGRGPTGTAAREGRPVVGVDFGQEPSLAPWREAALRCGYRSSSAFPLRTPDGLTAVLTVYSGKPGAFGEEELRTLEQLSKDLSFGLEAVRRREALARSEANYRFLFYGAEVALIQTRLDGSLIVDVNDRFARMLGYTRQELIGTESRRLWFDPADRERMIRELLSRDSITDLECRWKTRAGQPLHCLASFRTYADRQMLLGSAMDLTDRLRAEEALRQSQRLESLGVLAGGIAHDFNNMLTGILASLSLVREDASPEARDEILAEAEAAARRAQSLSRQLFTFSRGGAPVKTLSDLGPVVREAATFAARGSSSACRVEVAADLWPAEVDPGQVAQVVQNLVLNALEASVTGTPVDVSIANQRLELRHSGLEPGPYLALTVEDRGSGIPPEALARIFDPFFSTKERGSGLGLSVTYAIVARHGGRIDVASERGQGTTSRPRPTGRSPPPGTRRRRTTASPPTCC